MVRIAAKIDKVQKIEKLKKRIIKQKPTFFVENKTNTFAQNSLISSKVAKFKQKIAKFQYKNCQISAKNDLISS